MPIEKFPAVTYQQATSWRVSKKFISGVVLGVTKQEENALSCGGKFPGWAFDAAREE